MNVKELDFVRFSESELARLKLLPNQREALITRGIPIDLLGRFISVSSPFTTPSSRGALIVIGTTGLQGHVCLDPVSGEVVEVVDPRDPPAFVNTSVADFTRTAQLVFSLFPFHSRGAELEERDRSAKKVAAEIEKIDPAAMLSDRFWSTLVDDIIIGDFDEEMNELIAGKTDFV
jgi:hypothetical protein